MIVAGVAPDAQGTGLLPPTLASQLTAAAPAHAVAVGALRGLDYPRLPAARIPFQTSLLLVPTARGAVAVACLRPRVLPAGATAPDCGGVAATLRLHGLRAVPLGSAGGYAQSLASVLTLLDGERLADRRQLAGATRPLEQARAAAALHGAFGQAAAGIGRLQATPFAKPAQLALVAALRRASTAYAQLADAARAHDKGGYARAATAVDAAERAVDAAVARLNSA